MYVQEYIYQDGEQEFRGFIAYDESKGSNLPVVMVFPAFNGCNEVMQQHAKTLAAMGYIGFAVDVYGDGKVGANREECFALMTPFAEDRKMLLERISHAYSVAKTLPNADANKVAAIGFCFGGACVLDLARSGADVKAVVSLHGAIKDSGQIPKQQITASVLALHGYLDPLITREDVKEFCAEMAESGCDWQLHEFGTAMHSFTDPKANEIGGPDFGTVYCEKAAQRSWTLIKNLLAEVM